MQYFFNAACVSDFFVNQDYSRTSSYFLWQSETNIAEKTDCSPFIGTYFYGFNSENVLSVDLSSCTKQEMSLDTFYVSAYESKIITIGNVCNKFIGDVEICVSFSSKNGDNGWYQVQSVVCQASFHSDATKMLSCSTPFWLREEEVRACNLLKMVEFQVRATHVPCLL